MIDLCNDVVIKDLLSQRGDERKVAIWGTGETGKQLHEALRRCHIDVACFIDNCSERDFFCSKPVYSYDEYHCIQDKMLILLASVNFWMDIVYQLEQLGLSVVDDYLPFQVLENKIGYFVLREIYSESDCKKIIQFCKHARKMAILFGNCQTPKISTYLASNTIFSSRFFCLEVPTVCDYPDAQSLNVFEEGYWSECDVFISQRVRDENRFSYRLSTDYIEKRLNDETQRVWIPNIFFRGYFPQMTRNQHNVDTDLEEWGRFAFGDKYFDDLVLSGGSDVDGAIDKIMDRNFLPHEFVREYAEESIHELENREQKCDIIISDYIKEKYRDKVIFYGENHPTNETIYELTKRILSHLGIDEERAFCELEEQPTLQSQDMPIYPSVKAALGLPDSDDMYYANRNLWSFRSNIRNFLLVYANTCLVPHKRRLHETYSS